MEPRHCLPVSSPPLTDTAFSPHLPFFCSDGTDRENFVRLYSYSPLSVCSALGQRRAFLIFLEDQTLDLYKARYPVAWHLENLPSIVVSCSTWQLPKYWKYGPLRLSVSLLCHLSARCKSSWTLYGRLKLFVIHFWISYQQFWVEWAFETHFLLYLGDNLSQFSSIAPWPGIMSSSVLIMAPSI